MSPDDWKDAWRPMLQATGRDFAVDSPEVWGEPIEAGALLRYLEPLEFDCTLHSDARQARRLGHAGIVVPMTALASFALPLMWRPGDPPLFPAAERNAAPVRSPVQGILFGLEPATTHFLAVGSDADYFQPALVGDRLCRRGARLLSCTPRQTRIGRGAFIEWETEIINQRRERLALLRTTFYRYNRTHEGDR